MKVYIDESMVKVSVFVFALTTVNGSKEHANETSSITWPIISLYLSNITLLKSITGQTPMFYDHFDVLSIYCIGL